MTGSLPVFALIRIYWALITELREASKHLLPLYILWRKLLKITFSSSTWPALTTAAHTRPSSQAWGAGGQWSAGREPILTRLVVYCHFVSCIDQWLWFMIMWHHTVKHSIATHIWSLLICSGDFWPRLIDVTHVWSPLSTEPRRPAGLATHYVVKLFIVPPVFQTPQEFGGKKSITSF